MHLVQTLRASSLDVRLLWASVFLRMAGFGLTNQVLTLFLKSLAVSETRIGIFMTLTLVGDTVISYVLTWYADTIGRRTVMLVGSLMMFVSGVVFSVSSRYYVLLLAAIVGVLSPSGDETGPFKSVEEASIAHLTEHRHRPEVFAFHGLFATAGAALGSLVCGLAVDYLHLQRQWDLQHCYRAVFVAYAAIALLKLANTALLSGACEVGATEEDLRLLEDDGEAPRLSMTAGLSRETRRVLPRLLVIFMLDSLGYGFMPAAWVVYYVKVAFAISATGLGTLFFFTNAIDSVSSLPSAYLSKRLGPVRAMLVTQAPSAVFFITVAAAPNFAAAAALLVLYYSTSTMDVVPRQVLLTSVMPPLELTKVMGIVNIAKTFARCIGPAFTGKLAEHGRLHYGFVINGGCILVADAILAWGFLHLDEEILTKSRGA
ncbi:Major facilitator superfamily (MFS) profile domain-containing protein [[Candida] zeylanoides]